MTSALARKFALDVAPYVAGVSPSAATGWVRFKGITDFSKQISPTLQDVTDYDNAGWSSSEKTMQTFGITVKARRPFDGGVYDPGQEIAHAAEIRFGDAARVFVRWYDRNGGESRAGIALVGWDQSKTGVADVEEITVTFTGDGLVLDITNPTSVAAVPSIAAVSPSGKGTGQAVTITGSGFTGTVATSGVKFGATVSGGTVTGGTNATDFTVVSDSLITAVLPSGGAGATTVVVTNATGPTATAFPYTRAA